MGTNASTIHTRVMPARRGHAVSLIVTAQKEPQVMALANWTILDGVNFVRTEASPLVRTYNFLVLPAGIFAAATAWGEPGLVLSVLGALVYLLITTTGRALIRIQRAHQVDRAIDAEARRTHNLYSKLGN